MTNFFINGTPVTAAKGETILDVARRVGEYIPTMCYLPKVAPIASCRLCVVEVEEAEGYVLSCQTPPTEGIHVTTHTAALADERRKIMELYAVNHPLECGVCDKSGECDLQNKTLELGVSEQRFMAKEQRRPLGKWGMIQYDPTLCILCEKCVHTCNEAIGDDAIQISAGGYSSTIVPKGSDTLDCTFCGECIAVCPVGALISSGFQYRSNTWELEKTPSACGHCSAGCALTYETKQESSFATERKSVYRVTNDYNFDSLCGAGRFGFDYENRASKDEAAFARAVEALKGAESILFDSTVTNEEALLLQRMKEKLGVKLVNDDAYQLKAFLENLGSVTGKALYSADKKTVASSDYIIVLGTRIKTDNPMLRYSLTQAVRKNRAEVVYLHPMEDEELKNTVTRFSKYEVGAEEGVMALLADTFVNKEELPADLKAWFDDLDEGNLSSESNVGEEELAAMKKAAFRKKRFTLILGEDLLAHSRAANIAKIAGLMEKYAGFQLMVVPPKVNSLGCALICDLDESPSGPAVGYNVASDFTLTAYGASGKNSLDMPAMNQEEGTVTTMDKRVVPLSPAIPYEGYALGDLANALGMDVPYHAALTGELPAAKGFKPYGYDDLGHGFDNLGNEVRGYLLENGSANAGGVPEPVEELPAFNGTVAYRCQPVLHFNGFTAKASQLKREGELVGSAQFAAAAKIGDGDRVDVETGGRAVSRAFRVDPALKGTVALLHTFDGVPEEAPAIQGYRYQQVKISKSGTAS